MCQNLEVLMKRRLLVALLCVGLLAGVALAATPKQGGEMVIAFGTDPEWLDPLKITSAPAGMVLTHVAETLFVMTEDLEIEPMLAEGYEYSEDGLTLTLYLRQDVVFHDGEPFNAQAVKVNLDRFRDAVYAFLLYPHVQEVEVVDDYTVRLHLDQPFAPLLVHLTHNFVPMLSPRQLAAYPEGQYIFEPVGTGPFVFDRWVRGDHVRLVRNDAYWGEPPPEVALGLVYPVDSVVFKVVPEDSTRLVLLETGDVHAIMRVPPMDAPRVDATPGLELLNIPSVRTIYIGFHSQREPFTDPLVRQAINYAVDKEAIVEHVLGGAGRVSDAPISPGIFGYHPQERYSYDPEKAQELLAEAGYPDGFSTTLHHPTGRYMMDAAIAETVQAYLAAVGIDVELITMEWAAYIEFTRKPLEESEYMMYMLGWGCVTLDADYGLYSLYHSSQWTPVGPHRGFYKNPEVDELLEQARVVVDLEARDLIYAEATEILWEDAPWLFLHSETQINAQSAVAKGLIHHTREYILAHEAWLDQ